MRREAEDPLELNPMKNIQIESPVSVLQAQNGTKKSKGVRKPKLKRKHPNPDISRPSASSIPMVRPDKRVGTSQTESEASKLREEVQALHFLARRKEQEWEQVLNLLKQKELRLMKVEREVLSGRSAAQEKAALLRQNLNGSGSRERADIVIRGPVGATASAELRQPPLPVISSVRSHSVPPTSEPSEPPARCQNCEDIAAKFVCAGCSNRWYCTKECQVQDWDAHADECS